MKRSTKNYFSALCLTAGLALLSACGGGGSDSSSTPSPGNGGSNPPQPTTVAVTGVSFSGLSAGSGGITFTLNVGGTSTQTAVVAPTNATNKNVTWESDAPNVASVTASGTNNSTGTIRALAVGTAHITVKTVDGVKTASITITVALPPPPAPQIGSITPSQARPGEILTINGANFSTTADENQVSVNGTTAKVTGEATAAKLTVIVPNGSGSGTVKVTVANQTGTSSQTFKYLAAGSEPAPSEPEAGSTADVGNDWEGIYRESSILGTSYLFITSDGQMLRYDGSNGIAGDGWLEGSIIVTDDLRWDLVGSLHSSSSLSTGPVTGSGTFKAKTSMAGSYSRSSGASRSLSASYANANSLAITPASLQGKWSSTDGSIRLEFDPSGTLIAGTTSGTSFGTCKLSTTLVQSAPETSKNMFHLTLSAQNVAAGLDTPCKLDTASPYNGLAAIVLEPAGTLVSDGYFRTITFNAISDSYMLTGYLRKEP